MAVGNQSSTRRTSYWVGLVGVICFKLLAMAALAGAADEATPADQAAATTPWQRLEVPRDPARGPADQAMYGAILDMAVEPRGPLWVMANPGVYCWTGDHFERPKGEQLVSGRYLCTLCGGGDRPVFATQPFESVPNQGKIFKLTDGGASYVTTFYFDVAHEYPGIHVTKDGRIINWGQAFVAAFDGAEWKRHEANLGRAVSVVETDGQVHLFAGNKVFTIARDGELSSRELDLPAEVHLVHPTLWGDDRLLAVDTMHGKLLTYRLPDFKLGDLGEASSALTGFWSGTMLRAPDGSVWFGHHPPAEPRRNVLLRLAPDGKVETFDCGEFWVGSNSNSQPPWPAPALFAADGTVWMIFENQGIFQIKDGRIDRHGWREGLAEGGACAVVQDDRGNIFAGYHHGVWMMSADGHRSPIPPWTRTWTEHPLAAARPVQDAQERLWMALAGQPHDISCWDGKEFSHRGVTFDTANVDEFMVDDQEHLLITLLDRDRAEFSYRDVGPQDSTAPASLDAMLVGAVRRGVKRFSTNSDMSGPVVDREQRIWYALGNREQVRMYNGSRWLELAGYSCVHNTTTGEVLVSTSDRLARYDRGVLVPVELRSDAGPIRMFGPDNVTPFDPTIYARAPQDYLLVQTGAGGAFKLLQATFDRADLAKPWTFQPGDNRPAYLGQSVTHGRFGSIWTSYCACHLQRILGNLLLKSDFTLTPVAGQSYITANHFDDAAGNLWVHRGSWWNGKNSLFMKDTSRFRVEPLNLPRAIRRGSVYSVRAKDALGQAIEPNLYWQVDDGVWTHGSKPGELPLNFGKPGTYRVRVVAIGPQAEFCREPIDFICEARDPASE
jgi:hypothetical protein